MILFQKEKAYMQCLSALFSMARDGHAIEAVKETLPLVQDFQAFDADRYRFFREHIKSRGKEELLDSAFRGMKKEKKHDDYRYYLPKIEYYLGKLHVLILQNKAGSARRLSELLQAFPSAYYRNDSEAMRTLLRNELLLLFE